MVSSQRRNTAQFSTVTEVFDVPSTATHPVFVSGLRTCANHPRSPNIVCVDSPSPAPEQRQRKGSPQQGLMQPKVAGAVTSVWLSIGILIVVLQRPSDACDSVRLRWNTRVALGPVLRHCDVGAVRLQRRLLRRAPSTDDGQGAIDLQRRRTHRTAPGGQGARGLEQRTRHLWPLTSPDPIVHSHQRRLSWVESLGADLVMLQEARFTGDMAEMSIVPPSDGVRTTAGAARRRWRTALANLSAVVDLRPRPTVGLARHGQRLGGQRRRDDHCGRRDDRRAGRAYRRLGVRRLGRIASRPRLRRRVHARDPVRPVPPASPAGRRSMRSRLVWIACAVGDRALAEGSRALSIERLPALRRCVRRRCHHGLRFRSARQEQGCRGRVVVLPTDMCWPVDRQACGRRVAPRTTDWWVTAIAEA